MPLLVSIKQCLAQDPTLGGLVGVGVESRYYLRRAPQEPALPCVVGMLIISTAQTTHGKPGDMEDTLDEAPFQFSCIDDDPEDVDAVATAVRNALVNDVNGILAAAKITVTAIQVRDGESTERDIFVKEVDATFFHNPQT